MSKLEELREYLIQKIGNIVTTIYDRATGRYDRIRIKYDGCLVCSIYKGINDNFFDVIFYDPFTCKSRGYLASVSLIAEDIPGVIKSRIIICEDVKMGRINVNVDCSSLGDTMAKNIYMMTGRGSGKTRWITDLLKELNLNIKHNIKDVIFNDPATIIIWVDGSKTVVKCQKGETFDPEKGLAMAISKKVLGNDYGYYETFAKYVGRYNKKHKEK